MFKYIFEFPKMLHKKIKGYYTVIISYLFIISQFIVYLYTKSYLNYFGIDSRFFSVNLIADLSELFLNFLIISFLIVNLYLYYDLFNIIMISHDYRFKNLYCKLKENKKKTNIIAVLSLVILAVFLAFLIKCLFSSSYLYSLELQGIFALVSLIIIIIKCLIKNKEIILERLNIKKADNNSDIDNNEDSYSVNLFTFFSLIFICVIMPMSFGNSVAKSKEKYMVINYENDKYISLYNTDEFVIVSEYEYNEEDNSVYILNKNIKKISLYNLNISYKKFDKVKLETGN